ncbi:DctP family TRAP transporter solute-binding subunit [Methylomonas sp. LL1]|uniref:DctP family TRAP transporter solute-binding subunit n=1 Tax=Methylomonas sp. LL1 TaxID=2785785 RepID=UPI0018C3E025|nr:DctP family TRAP transporter solute-binding subunit [Methylomonas sp. LL1]QPK64548.1 DctP family TRAP transporter solute-binding subunit [Methylomonas sp. LL1]
MATKRKPIHYLIVTLLTLSIVLAVVGCYLYYSGAGPLRSNAPPPVAVARYSLRLGLNLSADSALHAASQRFAERIAERSQGRVEVKVYPDQQLGTDEQMVEMAREGKLDLLLTPTAKLSVDVPAMQYADLPFYFADRAELYSMLDGEPGNLLLAKLNDIGLVGIAFWENGFKQFTANRPLLRPEDFAGLRIRTMKSRLLMDQFSAMGAEPVVIDFATLHQALTDGAVDGQENPLVAIAGKRLYEVQSHLTLSNHAWLGYVFSASRKAFEGLPQDIRDLILDTARELAPWEREETARREAQFLETIRAAGVQVHTLGGDQRQRFAEALAPLVRGYGFEVGYDLLAKTDELRIMALLDQANRAGQPASTMPLLLGLDADLSGSGAMAGGAILRGMEMAVDEINGKGGILGRPLRIVARDHRQNPFRGLENIETFARLPGMLATMAGMHTSVIQDELETIHRLQLPFLMAWSAGTGVIHHDYQPSYTFRVSIDDTWVAPFLLEHALHRGRHITALLEQSAWGRSNEEALNPLIAKLPPGTVTLEWLNRGETDFAARLSELRDRGTDVIILVANAAESRELVEDMARMDNPLPIYAHWGFTGGDFWRQSQHALSKVELRFVQSILMDNGTANPRLTAFTERYRARYRLTAIDPIPAPAGTAHAYDLVHLLASAVRQAGTSDTQAIRAAMEKLKSYPGIVRDYVPPFTAERHDALGPDILHLAKYDERGRIVGAR